MLPTIVNPAGLHDPVPVGYSHTARHHVEVEAVAARPAATMDQADG
jgi:hypothetical protein